MGMSLEDIIHWLVAFRADRMLAWIHAPDHVWAHLYPEYIDVELDVTEKGMDLIAHA